MTRAGLTLLLTLHTGCSLLGLDEFELIDCPGDNEVCRPLNQREGIDVATASEVYQCAPDGFGCVLGPKDWDDDGVLAPEVPAAQGELRDCDDTLATVRPGLDERCDGLDNDCDGVIDEGVYVGSEEPVAQLGNVLAFAFGSPAASAASGSLDLLTISRLGERQAGGARLQVLDGSAPRASQVVVSDLPVHERPSCPVAMDDPPPGWHAPECYPVFIASDGLAAEGHLAAAIDTLDCAEGRVRVGEIRGETLRVSARPSEASCTGGYPMVAADARSCTSVPGAVGASRLELARMPLAGGAPQALVSWIGSHPLGHDACGAVEAEVGSDDLAQLDVDMRANVGVAALGIWHDPAGMDLQGEGGRSVGLTSANHDELPNVLGQTRGGAAPAIETVVSSAGDAHYIVAFGSDAGPSLHAVARFDARVDQCGAPAGPDVPLTIKSGEPWKTAAPSHARADYLTVSAGPELEAACGTGGVGRRLGIAWIEGCGKSDGSLWFATVDFAPSTGFCNPAAPHMVRPVDLSVGARALSLALAYRAEGVLSGEHGGGFWLATVEADRRVRVQRFAERDGRMVDARATTLGAADALGVGLRATPAAALELYVVRGVGTGANSEARLSKASIGGVCGTLQGQEE